MGIVYLLTNNNEQYKIGITKYKTPSKRLKNLQTGNSEIIDVISTFTSEYNNKIESVLHLKYKSKQLKGEWFLLEKNEVDEFIKICQKLHDNFKLLENSGNPFIKSL